MFDELSLHGVTNPVENKETVTVIQHCRINSTNRLIDVSNERGYNEYAYRVGSKSTRGQPERSNSSKKVSPSALLSKINLVLAKDGGLAKEVSTSNAHIDEAYYMDTESKLN